MKQVLRFSKKFVALFFMLSLFLQTFVYFPVQQVFADSRGWHGEYYNGQDLSGTPDTIRNDSEVNLGLTCSFITSSYVPGVPNIGYDDFSIRWRGYIVPEQTGNYFFQTDSDDGVRLYVNNVLVIDDWTSHAAKTDTTSAIYFEQGKYYPIRLEYYENDCNAKILLKWKKPGDSDFSLLTNTDVFNAYYGPTDITLSTTSIPENTTSIGNLSALSANDPASTYNYSLVSGSGSDDNAKFSIVGSTLSFSTAPDYETPTDIGDTVGDNTYSVRIKTIDTADSSKFYEKIFVIKVNDVNEPPVLNDTSFSVAENETNGTVVGMMIGSDVDSGTTLTYSITAGNTGNVFSIDNSGNITISDTTKLDYETTTSYNLIVQVSDGVLIDTATVTINVIDVNDTVYELSYDANNGIGNMTAESHTGSSIFNLQSNAFTRTGYTFNGWNTEVGGTGVSYGNGGSFTMPNEDEVLYAQWKAKIDTEYRVEYYLQNTDGISYPTTASETENNTGSTDTVADAGSKIFTGYTYETDNINNVQTGNIAPNGSLVLKKYYTINSYTLTFEENGGTSVADQTGIKYNTNATKPTDPTKTGYVFGGWFTDNTTFAHQFDFLGTPIKTNTTVYAKRIPATNTIYKVEHHRQETNGTYPISANLIQIFTGTTNTTVTAVPQSFIGYTYDSTNANTVSTGTVLANGSLTLKLYYTINTYTLIYHPNTGNGTMSNETHTGSSVFHLTANAFTKTGYTFAGWNTQVNGSGSGYTNTGSFAMPNANTTLYAQWTANTNTAYKVEHYKQNADSTWLTTANPIETLTGTTDTVVDAGSRVFTGYTYTGSHTGSTQTGSIAPDGSLILKRYYSINTYTITFESNGGVSVSPQTGIIYNTTATQPTHPTKTGYTFGGWYTDNTFTTVFDFSTPVTADRVVYAKWTAYSTGGGGGGGGGAARKDRCPGGDNSPSYYDGSCGDVGDVGDEKDIEETEETENKDKKSEKNRENISDNFENLKNIDKNIFNPSFKHQCFNLFDEKTIYQGNDVTMKFRTAHQMLYSYALTRFDGTKDYDPERGLTREEAARFMVEFAKNVLCRKPTYTYTNQFIDIKKANGTLKPFIKESYEYVIFHGDGGGASKGIPTTFRPKELISYDELAAVIVRLVMNSYELGKNGSKWAENYKNFLESRVAGATKKDIIRDNVAELLYDIYKINIYDWKDVGYVIRY